CTPERILIRVDLPAPFSPIRPTISPGSSEKEMFWRARVPVKLLPICSSASSGISGAAQHGFDQVTRGRIQRQRQRSLGCDPAILFSLVVQRDGIVLRDACIVQQNKVGGPIELLRVHTILRKN